MNINIHLSNGAVITLSEIEDFGFDNEDNTAVFNHMDETISVIPRENILLIKEFNAEEPTKH